MYRRNRIPKGFINSRSIVGDGAAFIEKRVWQYLMNVLDG